MLPRFCFIPVRQLPGVGRLDSEAFYRKAWERWPSEPQLQGLQARWGPSGPAASGGWVQG